MPDASSRVSSSSAPASEKEPAVFDANLLFFFDVLDYTGLLPELHRVLLPPAVVQELVALLRELGSSLPAEEWVEQRVPGAETLRRVEGEMIEGRGEEEAITLALDLFALIVLDDKRVRNYARRVGLQLTGTLGVLLRLHRTGLASRVLKEDLRLLEEADMRVRVRVLGGSLS
jgi:uncharacterized protein